MRFLKCFLFTYLVFFMIPVISNDNIVVEDPFLWLENNENPKTKEWLDQEKCKSEKYFQNNEIRQSLTKHLAMVLDYDVVEVPQKIEKNYIFSARLRGKLQSSLYKIDAKGVINPLIEIDENGLNSLVSYVVQKDGPLIAYGLSNSGSDWQTWRIRDLNSGKDLSDNLEGIKFTDPVWDKDGKGLFYFRFEETKSEDGVTNRQQLYYHKLGTLSRDDKKIFHASDNNLLLSDPVLSDDGRYLLFSKKRGFGNSNGIVYIDLDKNSSCVSELFKIEKARYDYIGSVGSRFVFVTNENAPNGKVISIDPSLRGSHRDHVLENEAIIEQACFAGNKIVISYLKDACSQIKIFDFEGKFHHQIDLPPTSTTTVSWKNSNLSGSKQSNEFFFPFVDFFNPTTIYKANVETCDCEIFLSPQIKWRPEDYRSKQVFYPSKDGTLVPMFIVWKKNVNLNQKNPLLLYGYGGFNVSITPFFDPKIISWLDLGGVYAIANIRGGGELGEAWHKAGMLKNKQVVFDDFIAASKWLIANGYTDSSKIAINGRSNGGLLAAACLIQKPELFKSVIIDVGVLDMLRFHLFTMGWFWTEEYGNPNNLEDFKSLHSYSPYHQTKAGTNYPGTLITTAKHDNRVVPLHSYKFAAALKKANSSKNPILLQVYENTGHASGKSLNQLLQEDVDYLYFLVKELGITVGNIK